MRKLLLSALIAATLTAAADDRKDGIFFINEDWYGHENSTMNYLRPDAEDGNFWDYRVIQANNPGIEIGCTAESGAIWNGRIYIISKQARDPGSSVTGGRITVADANTLKVLYQSELIDPSGARCDGRGFIGIDDSKAYISSSNGVWILDLDSFAVTGQIEGTENPFANGDSSVTNPSGALYHGQSGKMVLSSGRVFLAHQEYGVLVIDPDTDRVTDTIPTTGVKEGSVPGSIVKAKDGSLWVSISPDDSGYGTPLPVLMRIDPETLHTETVELGDSFAPSVSWHSWTPDTFCASAQKDVLYWSGGSNSWFSGTDVFCMDTGTREIKHLINLTQEGAGWRIYGCSMGIHPVTDELYMSLYHEPNTPTYIVRRCKSDGTLIRDYEMISHYWFPAQLLFADADNSSIDEINGGNAEILCEGNTIWANGLTGRQLTIYNISGTAVMSRDISSDHEPFTLHLPHGVYIVHAGEVSAKIRL